MMIDSHQHFWSLARGDYPWPDESVASIFRDFGPQDLIELLKASGVSQTVLVQATDSIAETEFLLDIATQNNFAKGVVGWVDLDDAAAPTFLDKFAQNAAFKGVRPMLQNIDDTNWILRPNVLANLAEVAARGLRMDALILPRHLEVLARVAEALTDLPIVIDHCAKPIIANGADASENWRTGMANLARFPNVFCKISGLATEVGPSWSVDGLQHVIDHVIAQFGPKRVMWGSDWPVINLVGDYGKWRRASDQLFNGLTKADRARVYGGTAAQFYGLEIK
ncbi:amidohydrolase family protein [Parasedimentitalea psychrophila]|uniref:Amidohydrolase family protein n=1 Tax=Parasedimentitalea psychrophila TaxID=2997337 RepID=A0A9Y2P2L6_9RHOB|nr:amidohydrolase family protein [Parasedimentitalea psychrophila]WIY25202.1 amidohydrolase family protein [Parasedimentitalea psychrophila]